MFGLGISIARADASLAGGLHRLHAQRAVRSSARASAMPLTQRWFNRRAVSIRSFAVPITRQYPEPTALTRVAQRPGSVS